LELSLHMFGSRGNRGRGLVDTERVCYLEDIGSEVTRENCLDDVVMRYGVWLAGDGRRECEYESLVLDVSVDSSADARFMFTTVFNEIIDGESARITVDFLVAGRTEQHEVFERVGVIWTPWSVTPGPKPLKGENVRGLAEVARFTCQVVLNEVIVASPEGAPPRRARVEDK
jgi:hypothetical protein